MTNGVNSYSLQTVWFASLYNYDQWCDSYSLNTVWFASLYNYDQWCEFLFFTDSLVCITLTSFYTLFSLLFHVDENDSGTNCEHIIVLSHWY